MNALRKILNNLQKYATIVSPLKKDLNALIPSLLEKQSLEKTEETDPDRETPGSEIGVNAATPQTLDTNECLKEFDDILEEINKDVTKGASLDDIDDVLKDIAQEDRKDSMFEVPKFDLADILAAFENLKDDDVDVTNSLISLDDSIISFSDIDIANSNEVIEQNDVISIRSEDRPEGSIKNISTKDTGNKEQNIDFNSMNTEETKENINHSESVECEKLDYSYIGGEKDQGIEKQTNSHEATNEEIDKTSEPTDKTNESIQNNAVERENDLTTKDVVFMDDSDDGGYLSSDFEFITEEEAKIDGLIINLKNNSHKRKCATVNSVDTIEVAVDQVSNAKKSTIQYKMKRKTRNINKDPGWTPESDTDLTSDDEFIPDDMEYLSRNNTRSKNNDMTEKNPERNNSITFSLRQIRIPPRRYNGSPRFRNLQINSDSFTSRNITEYNLDVNQNNEEREPDPGPSKNVFRGFSNECRNELATTKMEANERSNLFKTEIDVLERAQVKNSDSNFDPGLPDSIEIIPASSFMQENHPDSKKIAIKTDEMQDGPELNNILSTLAIPEKNNVDAGPGHSQSPGENVIPGTSTDNVPGLNNLNPGPSGTPEIPKFINFGAGPSCKRNRSNGDEIEKWRMYQMRTRLNRPQFVLDYSYRDHHRIYQDNELHQLFDPNRAPLPTARSMRLLENKSTVCKNSMLVEYQGVGFNVPLRRDSGSEDDEVKREANECAKKILEMYPGQNTRRSSRRRF